MRAFSEAVPGPRVCRGFQWRDGAETPDVDIPGFWLEAKVGGRIDVCKAMRQATADGKLDRWPMVVPKEDHETPVCIMRLPNFLHFYRQWYFHGLERPMNKRETARRLAKARMGVADVTPIGAA